MAKGMPTVTVIGPFPPPVHGAAVITAFMADIIGEKAVVKKLSIAPDGLERGIGYHLTRLGRVMAAMVGLAEGAFGPAPVYFSAAGGGGLLYNIVLAMMARVLGRRIFIHHHAFSYLDRWDWKMALLVRGAGCGTTHICLCSHMASLLQRRYGDTINTMTLSNAAFLPPRSVNARSSSSGALRVGHLSNLCRDKGLDIVLDVVMAAGDSVEKLVLAGPVADPDGARMIDSATAELGNQIDYRGPIYGDAKSTFFDDIDVFLFPTGYVNEAEPTVVAEALAAGVPVIAYGRGCIGGQVPGDAGLVVAPDQPFAPPALALLRHWSENHMALDDAATKAHEAAASAHHGAKAALQRIVSKIVDAGDGRGEGA